MHQNAIKFSRFKRGAERRNGGIEPESDLRQSEFERRSMGLGWISLFREIDESIILDTMSEFDVLSIPAGAMLLRPGEKNDCIYLLLSGRLAVHFDSSLNPDSATQINPGECIGELSAIDGKPVSAFVLALQEARVLQLSAESFWKRLMPIPGVGRNLLISLTERMRRSNEVALEASRKQLSLQFLKKELDVARQLQAGMLPLRRPMFPERTDLEVAAIMEPASEIGGDLFDAFFIEENLLFFCIGDVSGHGIPAALFMARSVGLIRISAMSTDQPGELLERINRELCEGNDANMFVTLFCGFYDVTSGYLRYSNAGHCAPLVVTGGGVTHLPIPKGALVGVFPDSRYSSQDRVLAVGEALICFTDGVTEAQTAEGKEFSVERLLDITSQQSSLQLEDFLQNLREEITVFTGNGALSDDCTVLAIRRPKMGCDLKNMTYQI